MIHLLDINVLIALCDPVLPHAAAAQMFFGGGLARNGWATCPLVENGFLRIFGSRKYPGGPGSLKQHAISLREFWPHRVTNSGTMTSPS